MVLLLQAEQVIVFLPRVLYVFWICCSINKNYVYVLYWNPEHCGSHYYCPLDSMALVQSVDDKAVFIFVGDANSHHSESLESVIPTDRHGGDALDFCTLSGCEQFMRGATHIASNRLGFMMIDATDIVDVSICSTLYTSDDCFNC